VGALAANDAAAFAITSFGQQSLPHGFVETMAINLSPTCNTGPAFRRSIVSGDGTGLLRYVDRGKRHAVD
jgi:hypothetical protein